MRLKLVPVILVAAAGGCETTKTMNVETRLVGSDFCRIQREKLSWSVQDTHETVHGIRRFNAKWDKRCGSNSTS